MTKSKKQSTSLRKAVQSVLYSRAERKAFTTTQAGLTSSTGGVVFALTQGCVQGDTNTQRDGAQCFIRHLQLNHRTTATVASGSLRYLVFQDHFNLGAVPVTADILQSAANLSPHNFLNVVEQKRFRVLLDETIDVSLAGKLVSTKMHKRLPFSPALYYNATTDVAGANGKNAIFILIIGNIATLTYDYEFSMEYIDQ